MNARGDEYCGRAPFRTPGRVVGGGRGAAHRRMHRSGDAAFRQAANRLARPLSGADRSDARPVEEAGYRYCMDWALDDQPIWMSTTRSGQSLSVPYPIELNDSPGIVVHTPYRPAIQGNADRPVRRDARAIAQIPAGLFGRVAPIHHPASVPPARALRCWSSSCSTATRLWITTPGEIALCEHPRRNARVAGLPGRVSFAAKPQKSPQRQ